MVRYLRWLMSAVLHCTAGHEQGVHRRRHRGDQESRQARPSAVLPHAQGASLEEERPPRSKREEEGAHEGQSFIQSLTLEGTSVPRPYRHRHHRRHRQSPRLGSFVFQEPQEPPGPAAGDGWMDDDTHPNFFFSCSGLSVRGAMQLSLWAFLRMGEPVGGAFSCKMLPFHCRGISGLVLSCLVLSCFRRRPQTDLSVSNISDLQVLASPVLRCLALSSSTFPT